MLPQGEDFEGSITSATEVDTSWGKESMDEFELTLVAWSNFAGRPNGSGLQVADSRISRSFDYPQPGDITFLDVDCLEPHDRLIGDRNVCQIHSVLHRKCPAAISIRSQFTEPSGSAFHALDGSLAHCAPEVALFTQRNPTSRLRIPGSSDLRSDRRRSFAAVCQDPPRTSRARPWSGP